MNHVCKCKSQCWPLQKFSSLSELSAVLYSGHEIPLIGAGYAGYAWALCVAEEIHECSILSQMDLS